jgi:hypothetical protein
MGNQVPAVVPGVHFLIPSMVVQRLNMLAILPGEVFDLKPTRICIKARSYLGELGGSA